MCYCIIIVVYTLSNLHESLIVFDFHIVEPKHFVLLESPLSELTSRVGVWVGMERVLQEGPSQRIDQFQGEFLLSFPHAVQTVQEFFHPSTIFFIAVAINELVAASQVMVNLLQKPFYCCVYTAKRSVIQLEFQFGDGNVAGLTFEQVPLQVIISLDIESNHKCFLADLSTVLGLSCMMSAELAGEAHNDDIGEIGHTCSASFHVSHFVASFARHFETKGLVLHQLFFLERLHKVQFIAHYFSLPLLL